MKNALLITLSLFLTFSCGNSSQKQEIAVDESNEQLVIDTNTVYVYYFHGKQRCKTCMAVEKVAKEVIDSSFAAKPNVKFLVLLTEDQANKALVEKYEIGWNSLIIAKGDNSVNITEEAFANAIKKPEALIELINKEINSRL